MASTLEHLKPHSMFSGTEMLNSLPIAPAMQAIIVDSIPVVDPQLASIIGDNAESVMACSTNRRGTDPADCKMIAPPKATPLATCVAIVHYLDSASHVGSAAGQVLTAAALAEVERMLQPRATRASSRFPLAATAASWLPLAAPASTAFALGTCYNPSVSSVRAMIPEEHASSTTALKELKSHKTPPIAKIFSGHSTTPTM
jgi:hypothetical protein